MTSKKTFTIIGLLFILGVLAFFGYQYHLNTVNDYDEETEQAPMVEKELFRERIYRVIADTAFIHYEQVCPHSSTQDSLLAFIKYGQQVLSYYQTDVNDNEDLNFVRFALTNTKNWNYSDTLRMKCYTTRTDTLRFGYVDSKVLVTEDEFLTYYQPLFGPPYQGLYSSIPVEFKRSLLKFLRDNDYVDRYRLSPSFDRADYIQAYGNFTRTEKPVKNESMAIVLDEIESQSSRLIIFGRISGTRNTYVAYNEYFNFPATVEFFNAHHRIAMSGGDVEEPGTDGIFVKFDLETTKALLFDQELKRFEWYKQNFSAEEIDGEE